MPGAVDLVGHERLTKYVPGCPFVLTAGAAVARRRAGHRIDACVAGCVEGGGAGYFDGGVPGAVDLVGHERLIVPVGVRVSPAGAAVTRLRTRHRGNPAGSLRLRE